MSRNQQTITSPAVILAVDPGARETGVAVLAGGELLYYRVKTQTERKSIVRVLEKVQDYIERMIEKHQPSYLAIKRLSEAQSRLTLLYSITEQIKAVASGRGLSVCEYSSKSVRERLCGEGDATRGAAAILLAKRYRELERYLHRTQKWEREYYSKLFDAVAVGLVCYHDLRRTNSNLQLATRK